MDQFNGSTLIGLACTFMIFLVFAGPILFYIFFMIKKNGNEIKAERVEIKKNQDAIRNHDGVVAPGVIVAARRVKSWDGNKNRSNDSHIIDYEVDVTPEDGNLFRTSFRDELYSRSHTLVGNEMISEHGRRIWVMYDPRNTSRAFLDHHYQDQHEDAIDNERRGKFNKLTESNEELKKTGEQAEAIITRVDDLNLPYPSKKGRAMHLYFDITPKTGLVFQSEGDLLIADSATDKYSVGRKVFVRFDPLDPKKAVLDTERNKSLN